MARLYAPCGFSSEFIFFKEFFGATLDSLGSVEDYLATIKYISTNLKAKDLELLNKLVIAWTLYNLGPAHDGFVASVTQSYRAETAEIDIDSLFADLINELYRLQSIEESALITRKKSLSRAKYGECGRIGHREETCYKLYPELREQGGKDRCSDSANIAIAAQDADLEVSDLLLILYSDLPVTTHSLLYSAWPVVLYSDLLTNLHSDLPVAAHSPLHSAWPVALHSDLSIGGPALSAKYLSRDWILDSGATSHICCDIDLFDKIAPISARIAWGNITTLPARGKGTITIILPNSASAVLDSVLYMPELEYNILSLPCLIRKGASISFAQKGARIYLKSGPELFATTNAKGLFYISFESTQFLTL